MFWSAATGAHVVRGAILVKYKALGASSGALGYPTSDQLATPDKIGAYNHFSGGSLYWTKVLGAHEILNAIQAKWGALGWERGRLGYPTTDEFAVAGGRRSTFQHGFIVRNSKTGVISVAYVG